MLTFDQWQDFKMAKTEYQEWLQAIRPRTCFLVYWLHSIGAMPEPGPMARQKALKFSAKHTLLGTLAERNNDEALKINALLDIGVLDNNDLTLYGTWVLWTRFQEYIPRRFVLPGGQEKVLQWVRHRLRRPELTASETMQELQWQANRISVEWEDNYLPLL